MSSSLSNKPKDCKLKHQKEKLDDIYFQLDDYYFELKERLIELINQGVFERDVEFFLIKMFKLDEKDSEFNLIDYIKQMKSLNDELFSNHKTSCNADYLLNKIELLNDKIKKLQEDNDTYKLKIDQLSADVSKYKTNALQFENLNINLNSNPYYTADRLLINDLFSSDQVKNSSNLNTSRSMHKKVEYEKGICSGIINPGTKISNRKQLSYSSRMCDYSLEAKMNSNPNPNSNINNLNSTRNKAINNISLKDNRKINESSIIKGNQKASKSILINEDLDGTYNSISKKVDELYSSIGSKVNNKSISRDISATRIPVKVSIYIVNFILYSTKEY